MTVRAVDVSNYTGLLGQGFINALRRDGWQHVIVRAGLEHGPQAMPNWEITLRQVDALTAAGIDWSLYIWMYPSWNPEQTIDDTIALLGTRPWKWGHVDCEELRDIKNPGHNIDWLYRALTRLHARDKYASIYTGGWWWNDPRMMDGARTFSQAGVPLWSADFDGIPDLNDFSFPYGGWGVPLFGKQYEGSGSATVNGQAVDYNVFDDSLLTSHVPPTPPPPPPTGLPIADARTWIQTDMDHAEEEYNRARYSYDERTKVLDKLERGEVSGPE